MCAQPPSSESAAQGTAWENCPPGTFPAADSAKVVLLGLGNDLLTDDAIGLRLAAAARERLRDSRNVTVLETTEMGLSLLDLIIGFDSLLLVDAIQSGQVAAGVVHQFDLTELKIIPAGSPHFLGVGEVLALGRQLGLKVPDRVRVFAIEVQDPFTVSQQLTAGLEGMMPRLVQEVIEKTQKMSSPPVLSASG